MAFPWDFAGSVASGLLGIGGGLLQSSSAQGQARSSFKRSLWADSTKYQRAVADLKAAGLNPILAVGGGLHAGGGVQAPMAPVPDILSGAASSARQALTQAQELRNMREQNLNLAETRNLIQAQADHAWSSSGEASARAAQHQAATRLTDVELQQMRELFPLVFRQHAASARNAELGLSEAGAMSRFWENAGTLKPWMQMIFGGGGAARRFTPAPPRRR